MKRTKKKPRDVFASARRVHCCNVARQARDLPFTFGIADCDEWSAAGAGGGERGLGARRNEKTEREDRQAREREREIEKEGD